MCGPTATFCGPPSTLDEGEPCGKGHSPDAEPAAEGLPGRSPLAGSPPLETGRGLQGSDLPDCWSGEPARRPRTAAPRSGAPTAASEGASPDTLLSWFAYWGYGVIRTGRKGVRYGTEADNGQ
ncbi:hypothetical protein C9F11_39540 [Streptomyces sp. YIM 121038]|nr:hypothetical protein C9F11_39540 [Streptomyces sp. YIM 121038]